MAKTVELSVRHWNAIVRHFRADEKLERESLARPGQEDRWREEFKKGHPEDFRVYDAARLAIDRVESKRRKAKR